jgi:hypothetical protein
MNKNAPLIEKQEPETTDELVDWFVNYQRNSSGTHSGMAMLAAVRTLINAGLTTACFGCCAGKVEESFRRLIYDQEALNQVAQRLHWNDPEPIIGFEGELLTLTNG